MAHPAGAGSRHLSERGSALVELAVVLPLLALILVGTIDFARVFYTAIELSNAARAGAQYGAIDNGHSLDVAGMKLAAQNAVNITGLTWPVDPTTTCACAPDDGTGSPWPGAVCTGTCVTGHLVIYVTVTATKAFSTITPFPGIPTNMTIRRAATMRVAN